MDKRIVKARVRLNWRRFWSNSMAVAASFISVAVVVIGLIFLSWSISAGPEKILNFLKSPLAGVWYFLGAVAIVTWAYAAAKANSRKKD